MRINLKKTAMIEAALATVNGKAAAFVLQNAAELMEFAQEAEVKLAAVLPKKAWAGAKELCRPAGPSAGAYRHQVKSTQCVLERGASGWFLSECASTEILPNTRSLCDVTLTPLQAMAAPLYADKCLKQRFSLTELDNVSNHKRLGMETKARAPAGVS